MEYMDYSYVFGLIFLFRVGNKNKKNSFTNGTWTACKIFSSMTKGKASINGCGSITQRLMLNLKCKSIQNNKLNTSIDCLF